jgi:hypothetical protein
MAKSNFFLNDNGIIEIVTIGDRTPSAIQDSAKRVFALAKKVRQSGRPVLILNDISQMGTLPPEGHKTFADISKEADYDRFALVGSDNIARLGANLIAQAIGKSEELKYFDSREAATAWLLEFRR